MTVQDIENFDEYLAWLKKLPKVLVNPRARWIIKEQKRQKIYIAKAEGETGKNKLKFRIYMRQHLKRIDSYSCGILIRGKPLARYNGSSHSHRNAKRSEEHDFPVIKSGTCHIHEASQIAIIKKKRVDHYAVPTKRYNSVDSALVCLFDDYNVTTVSVNQGRLSL